MKMLTTFGRSASHNGRGGLGRRDEVAGHCRLGSHFNADTFWLMAPTIFAAGKLGILT